MNCIFYGLTGNVGKTMLFHTPPIFLGMVSYHQNGFLGMVQLMEPSGPTSWFSGWRLVLVLWTSD